MTDPIDDRDQFEPLFANDEDFDPAEAFESLTDGKAATHFVRREKIGEGGMGLIYRVYDRQLTRNSVIKVARPEIARNRQTLSAFINEARTTARLEHPNIVPVHAIGVLQSGELFFSMKEIVGKGLDQILDRIQAGEPGHSLFSLLTIFRKVCDAIACAHSHGIVNRDIKPDNIMVGEFGEVLVVDWGLARNLHAPEEVEGGRLDLGNLSAQMTQHGDIKGSPAFMSPEQALGENDRVDERTDVFLLGATLYTIATLTPPYMARNLYDMVMLAEKCRPKHPQERAPERELPGELCRIIMKAMRAEPERRYQSVKELAADIDDFLTGDTASEARTFETGEMLMREGEAGDEAYLITAGRVRVYLSDTDRTITLSELSAGDTIGEMALIDKAPRSASVQALTRTQVIVITPDLIARGLGKLPPWMDQIIRALVERLRTASDKRREDSRARDAYRVLNHFLMTHQAFGEPMVMASRQMATAVGSSDAINQIAADVSLPPERVAAVLNTAANHGLIVSLDEEHLHIPDTVRFSGLLAALARQLGIEPPFHQPREDVDAGLSQALITLTGSSVS